MKRGFSQNVFFEENKLPWVICTLTCECTRIATTYNIGVLGGELLFRYIKQIHQLWHHIHQKDVVSNGWINKYAFNCRKLGESKHFKQSQETQSYVSVHAKNGRCTL